MNKMTHLKFNLNNFLFALSEHLDKIHMKNINGVNFSSKRIAYIALRIAKLNDMANDFISDLLSYSLIAHNPLLKSNIDYIPFNDLENIKSIDCTKIIAIASFFELQIQIQDNLISNKEEIIKIFECKDCFDEIYTENILYLMEFDSFLFDLTNEEGLPFYILNYIDDFTQEISYASLVQLSKLFNEIYYQYTNRKQKNDISAKISAVAKYFNFDEKDTSRLIISGYLSYIGFLSIDPQFLNGTTIGKAPILNLVPYKTYTTLNKIYGFEDIGILAGSVNENINGSGYPFKKQNKELSFKMRLLTIIYKIQALEERRSYRKAFKGDEIYSILEQEATNGLLDITLLKDIQTVIHI